VKAFATVVEPYLTTQQENITWQTKLSRGT